MEDRPRALAVCHFPGLCQRDCSCPPIKLASSHRTASYEYLQDCCAGCGQLNAVSASRYKLHCCIIRYLALFLKGVDKDPIPGSLRIGGDINDEPANRLPRLNCPDPAP